MTTQFAPIWNNGTVDFTCIKANVTNTASGAGSTLLDLQVGGVTKFKIDKTGAATFGGSFTFPATDGTNGQVLTTNGSGVLTWSTVSGGGGGGSPGGSTTQIQFNDAGVFGGSSLLTFDKTTGAITAGGQMILSGLSLTGSQELPNIDISGTWNTTGVPTIIKAAITDTASGTAASLLDLSIGSNLRLKCSRLSTIESTLVHTNSQGGTVAIGVYGGSTGAYFQAYNNVARVLNAAGTTWIPFTAGSLGVTSTGCFSFGSTSNPETVDLTAFRDAANTWSQRNGTNAQTFRLENTYTSSTNREYFQQSWVTNELRMGTAVGSAGGTQRNTVIGTWNAAGTWSPIITVNSGGYTSFTGGIRTTIIGGTSAEASITFANAAVWQPFTSLAIQTYSGAFANRLFLDSNSFVLTPAALTSGAQTGFTYTGAAATGQTASTEATEVLWTMPVKTWATGTLATQRFFRITAPTVAFSGASTAAFVATLDVAPPVAGTNATFTASAAIRVKGAIALGDGTETTSTATSLDLYANQTTRSAYIKGGVNAVGYLGQVFNTAAWSNPNGLVVTGNSATTGFKWVTNLQTDSWTLNGGLVNPSANTYLFLNSTNAQTVHMANTYTSSTNYEYGTLQWTTNEWRIGTSVGSAGGTQRNVVLGGWNAAGTWIPIITINPTSGTGYTKVNLDADGYSYWQGSTTGYSPQLYSRYGLEITFGNNGMVFPRGTFSLSDNTYGVGVAYTATPSGRGNYGATPTANGWLIGCSGGSYPASGNRHTGSGWGVLCGGGATPSDTNADGGKGGDFRIKLNSGGAGAGTGVAGADGLFIVENDTESDTTVFSISQKGKLISSPYTTTTLIASTESTDINFNLARTVTFAAGALTTQRAFRIQAPTYAFASASTITTATTLSISGAPVAGTNATITNAYALNVESGTSNFNGRVFITNGTNSVETSSWAGAGFIFRSSGTATVGLSPGGLRLNSVSALHWAADTSLNNPDLFVYRDAANTLSQRNGTSAQTSRLENTYTSATNREYFQQSWVSNQLRMGTAVGSAGGTQRVAAFGNWNAAGTWTASFSIQTNGDISVADGENITVGTTTGTKIGTSSTEKLGLWGATPVVQSTGWAATNYTPRKTIDAASTNLNELIDIVATLLEQLKTYGALGA